MADPAWEVKRLTIRLADILYGELDQGTDPKIVFGSVAAALGSAIAGVSGGQPGLYRKNLAVLREDLDRQFDAFAADPPPPPPSDKRTGENPCE